ncbi:heavy metal response regulator transcription factor [Massilia dura]|uniref:Heavy metal response regulator transcription factor n=1 Tax=Pseudoduganella dura TaxID=321982 RepID=A0A6I3X4Q1_9BURK|nr:heavy metal response regulator transcription factor [Pseudoduganella dura]MUI11694.1 heavy metal response regulator transcription factor [Pseudoduganella dura]GGX78390.1 DNA-binding response regulator [Pseudoduganella dura]
MTILVIEDEPKTGDYLQRGLAESGFAVRLARNGRDGLAMARDGGIELVVLDVMLPRMDGWQVLEALRGDPATEQVPVMFLTARDEVHDRVRGLELGADDYLVKPFAFVELVARIRTLLRRGPVREEELLCIGDLEIDVIRRRVRRGAATIVLTAQEFALLHLLARRQGQVLSRSLIASQVWDMNFDSDTNVIDAAIRRLRRKIDDPFAEKLIHTRRGMGYVCEAGPAAGE